MKFFNLPLARTWALILGLVCLLQATPVLAQNNNSSQQGSGTSTSSQTTRTTTTTTTSQPTQTTWVDPIWLVLGGIALLAIILIAILAARRRGRDHTAVVHERETVIKKE